jgi:hypothetical protein
LRGIASRSLKGDPAVFTWSFGPPIFSSRISSSKLVKFISKKYLVAHLRNHVKTAERGGFEPPVPFSQYAGLANRWIKPLSHLSRMADRLSKKAGQKYKID